jgi:hypothetical protein
MLDSSSPEASVSTSVSPNHFSLALSFIIVVLSNVSVTTFPFEYTLSVLFIILILSFISVTAVIGGLFLPFTVAVFETANKLTCVVATVCPFVLPEAFRFSINVLANKNITIREEIRSISISQAVLPFAFIFVAISPDMDTVTISFTIVPLANITFTMDSFPDTISGFRSI